MIKATTFLVTALINIGIGAMMFFMLMLSLNGFTSSQAELGMLLFIVWALLTALIAGVLSFLSVGYLIKNKSYNPALAAFIASTIYVIVGAASDFVGFIAALFLTSAMR